MSNTSESLNFYARFYDNESKVVYVTEGFVQEGNKYIGSCFFTPDNTDRFGSLLIDFINMDLLNFQAFEMFFQKWGYAGFENFTKSIKTTKQLSLSRENYKKLITKVRTDLINKGKMKIAQNEFIATIEYCFNLLKLDHLERLTSSKRYHVGLSQNKIGKYDKSNISEYYTNINLNYRVIYPDQPDQIEALIKNAGLSEDELSLTVYDEDIEISEEYTTNNFLSICFIELMELIKKNASINKCPNCNKYFIPLTRSNEVYCDTCKATGYQNKVRNDEYMTAYRNEYKARNKKVNDLKRDNSNLHTDEAARLSEWMKIASKKAKDKDLSICEFKIWLKNKEGEINGIH